VRNLFRNKKKRKEKKMFINVLFAGNKFKKRKGDYYGSYTAVTYSTHPLKPFESSAGTINKSDY